MKAKAFLTLFLVPMLLLFGCDAARQLLSAAPKPTARLQGVQFGEVDLKSAKLLFDVGV